MLRHITPVLLTYDEAPNVARTLSRLTWATGIVVVDSGSTDETRAILAKFPQVRVFSRPFDTHAKQWRYAIEETGIVTDWILRLDADYVLSEELINELGALDLNATVNGYRVAFDYAIFSNRAVFFSLPGKYHFVSQRLCLRPRSRAHQIVGSAWSGRHAASRE